MGDIYITNYVKKLFIAAFQEIFAHDADFTYNKTDAALGRILISSKYAIPSTENKVPQLVFSTAAYSTEPTTLGGNFKESIPGSYADGTDKAAQKRYANMVQFSLGIDCMSTVKAECERLADKVFNSLTMDHAPIFDALNMNIRGVQVGESIPRNQYPQYQFVSQIIVRGDFVIQWVMGPPTTHPLLTNIKETIQTLEI